MTRHLYIVRHAQTHPGEHYSDKERELKPEGITQAIQLGKHITESNYSIDLIITSDAERAKATALLIASTINYPVHQVKFAEKIYSGDMNDLLHIIKEIPDSIQHVLMVGHYPTIVELNNYLSDSVKQSMSTCELTTLTISTTWPELSKGCGNFISEYHPTH